MSAQILVVDDEASMREFLTIALGRMGHEITAVDSSEKALEEFNNGTFDLVLSDIRMPGGLSGVELLEKLKETDPAIQVILMTAYASVDTAVSAIQFSATDYIVKPFPVEEIKMKVDRALEKGKLFQENRYLRQAMQGSAALENILGSSPSIIELRNMIEKVAPTFSTVMITGESGTGKELVARALHKSGIRAGGPFVTVNCGAIPEGLLESELFGHKRGAFTGAIQDGVGLFRIADTGTLFLDEIGDTPPGIQIKLLRALQEREVLPVGATKPVKVDVRVIAATNSALDERVNDGTFREDLFYRLNVVPIHIPPLRERSEDILLLAEHFLAIYAREKMTISDESVRVLKSYPWPGNVRELENAIESAVVLSGSRVVELPALPKSILQPAKERIGALPEPVGPPTLESIEKAYIHWVLKQSGGVKKTAAETLGIDPSTLHRKMDRYGLREEHGEE
ncbi:sigma-54-dependent transcriptional regulator [Gemmatimonadota bacterium]